MMMNSSWLFVIFSKTSGDGDGVPGSLWFFKDLRKWWWSSWLSVIFSRTSGDGDEVLEFLWFFRRLLKMVMKLLAFCDFQRLKEMMMNSSWLSVIFSKTSGDGDEALDFSVILLKDFWRWWWSSWLSVIFQRLLEMAMKDLRKWWWTVLDFLWFFQRLLEMVIKLLAFFDFSRT